MAKVYYSEVGQTYSTLVSHNCDLTNEDSEYFGLFEYALMREDNGSESVWEFVVFDIFESEVLVVEELDGLDEEAIDWLIYALHGLVSTVDIADSDYYGRLSAYSAVLEDPVLRESVAAYSQDDADDDDEEDN